MSLRRFFESLSKHLRPLLLTHAAAVYGLGMLVSATAHTATEPDPGFWITDGHVNAMVRSGPNLFIGGDFSYVGPNTGHAVGLNASTAAANSTDPAISGDPGSAVYAVIPDGNGGWYVGGEFTTVLLKESAVLGERVSRRNLVHITSDRRVDTDFDPSPDGPVRALALVGDTLYVGGEFGVIAQNAQAFLAAVDADTAAIASWRPTLDGIVHVLHTVSTGSGDGATTTLFAGGEFTQFDTVARTRIAAAQVSDASGATVTAWNPGADDTVRAIAASADGETLYVGGDFLNIGGAARNRIAAVLASDGTTDPAFNPGADGPVYALAFKPERNADNQEAITGGEVAGLFAAGDFDDIAATPQPHVARLNLDGSLYSVWTPITNGPVSAMALDEEADNLYLAGEFTEVTLGSTTETHHYLAKLSALDESSTGWNPQADGFGRAITVSSGTVFAGGEFTSAGGLLRKRLAKVSVTSGIPTTWAPQVGDEGSDAGWEVNAFALSRDGNTVYVGGNFAKIDGTDVANLAKLHAEGTTNLLHDGWTPDVAGGTVTSLQLNTRGGNIRAMAVAASNPAVVYAGTEEGVYRSTDGGATWSTANNGMETLTVYDLAVHPANAELVYAATEGAGILRSTDGGITWSAANNGIEDLDAFVVVIDPTNPRVLYAGTAYTFSQSGSQFSSTGGVYKSVDGGATWTDIAEVNKIQVVLGDIQAIAVDPNDSDTVYVGTRFGVIRTLDGGETWTAVNGRGENDLPESDVRALAVSTITSPLGEGDEAVDVSIVYAATGTTVARSMDQGNTWTNVGALLQGAPIHDMELTSPYTPGATSETVYVATEGRGVFKSLEIEHRDNRRFRTFNQGIFTTFDIYSLAVDPNDPDNIYAGGSSAIVYHTPDGASWTEAHEGIPNDVLFAGGDFTTVDGAARLGLASVDTSGGVTDWDPLSDGAVNALLLNNDESTLYAAGTFSAVGGEARNGLAALDPRTAAASAWNPSANGAVNDLALTRDKELVYVGGDFTNVGGAARTRLAALETDTGAATAWQPQVTGGAVNSIVLTDNEAVLFAGGAFTTANGEARSSLASFDTTEDDTNLTTWYPAPNGIIDAEQALTNLGNVIYAGGQFTHMDGIPTPYLGVFRFTQPTVAADPSGDNLNTGRTVTLTCEDAAGVACNTMKYAVYAPVFSAATDTKVCQLPASAQFTTVDISAAAAAVALSESACLTFFSVTVEGIRSNQATERYIFDYDGPSISAEVASGTYTFTQTVPLICDDGELSENAVSGCAEIFYTTDGSAPTFRRTSGSGTTALLFEATGTTVRYTEPVPVMVDTRLRYRAVDRAGNASAVGSQSYVLERGATGVMDPWWLLAVAIAAVWRRIYWTRAAAR